MIVWTFIVDCLIFLGLDDPYISFVYGFGFGAICVFVYFRKVELPKTYKEQTHACELKKDKYTNFVYSLFYSKKGKRVGFFCEKFDEKTKLCKKTGSKCLNF